MRGKCAKEANEGIWGFKALLVLLFFIISFFIENTFFVYYAKISLVISGLFLIFQNIMIIDAFYLLGEALASRYNDA